MQREVQAKYHSFSGRLYSREPEWLAAAARPHEPTRRSEPRHFGTPPCPRRTVARATRRPRKNLKESVVHRAGRAARALHIARSVLRLTRSIFTFAGAPRCAPSKEVGGALEAIRGVHRHVLARARRLRQRGAGRRVSQRGDRPAWRLARLRA